MAKAVAPAARSKPKAKSKANAKPGPTAKATVKPKPPKPAKPKPPKPKPEPKAPSQPDAAVTLLQEVGSPHNINTVDIDDLRCVKAWLTTDDRARAATTGELAVALYALLASPVFDDIRDSAWNSRPEFTVMVALGKAIDRLIRARLPLAEQTLLLLTVFSSRRADLSVLRLTTQLEHYAKTEPVGAPLRAAIVALMERFSWRDYAAMRARLDWVASPAQPQRLAPR